MGLRAYARHRGVTLSTVQKAIASGRITTNEDGKIDPEAADAQWAANTGPQAGQANGNGHAPHEATGYARFREERESFAAKNEELRYLKLSGATGLVADMEREAFELARVARDQLLALPRRLAAVAEGLDRAAREKMFEAEVRKILKLLAQTDDDSERS